MLGTIVFLIYHSRDQWLSVQVSLHNPGCVLSCGFMVSSLVSFHSKTHPQFLLPFLRCIYPSCVLYNCTENFVIVHPCSSNFFISGQYVQINDKLLESHIIIIINNQSFNLLFSSWVFWGTHAMLCNRLIWHESSCLVQHELHKCVKRKLKTKNNENRRKMK